MKKQVVRRLNKQKGLSLIEVLVSSLVLSIIVLGYIQTQMKSIINTEYSNKTNLISLTNNDFTAIFKNYIVNAATEDDKKEIITKFKNSKWETNLYGNDISKCYSTLNLSDSDYCDEELMIKNIVKNYKESIETSIPDAKFKMFECENNSNICLMVSWGNIQATETTCNTTDITNCIITEIQK